VSQKLIDKFITRWDEATGTEKANYSLFLTELTELLGLPRPEPSQEDTRENEYVFERRVSFKHGDGTESRGYIDLYKKGCFVLEAKQTGRKLESTGWDSAMLRARGQAEQYARALPAQEGRPPFLIVTDVGRSIELYSEFTRSGSTYVPYPDPRSHRIRVEDLKDESVCETLRAVWLDPMSLDPSLLTAKVTTAISRKLAQLAKALEHRGHESEKVAGFLMRCLFSMFSEDVGLLPDRSFTELLKSVEDTPAHFKPMVEGLWHTMNLGGFSTELRAHVRRFNGGLFSENTALELERDEIELLLEAAYADWRHVEPAIFGTLLERALDPQERHKMGAHFTPRAYVERLVLPTIMEPLRGDWEAVQAAAYKLDERGEHQKAVQTIQEFHFQLCHTNVLDPACGSGNFLYVTLEHMKRLEGEIFNTLHEMGETQSLLELEGVTVNPSQFFGLEVNPWAARIAELVLWIGYLQWHFRSIGGVCVFR